jgi:adenine-specific DNA-methyltransferase
MCCAAQAALGEATNTYLLVMLGVSGTKPTCGSSREWVFSQRPHPHRKRSLGSSASIRNERVKADRPGLFYPIYIDPTGPTIAQVGSPLAAGVSVPEQLPGLVALLPIRKNRTEGNWQWYPETLRERMKQGRVRIGGNASRGFVIYILKDGEYAKIQRGEFEEAGRADDGSIIVEDNDASYVRAVPGSQWRIATHDATQYGSRMLGDVLPDRRFPFPKSLYAVRDTLRFFIETKPDRTDSTSSPAAAPRSMPSTCSTPPMVASGAASWSPTTRCPRRRPKPCAPAACSPAMRTGKHSASAAR